MLSSTVTMRSLVHQTHVCGPHAIGMMPNLGTSRAGELGQGKACTVQFCTTSVAVCLFCMVWARPGLCGVMSVQTRLHANVKLMPISCPVSDLVRAWALPVMHFCCASGRSSVLDRHSQLY